MNFYCGCGHLANLHQSGKRCHGMRYNAGPELLERCPCLAYAFDADVSKLMNRAGKSAGQARRASNG